MALRFYLFLYFLSAFSSLTAHGFAPNLKLTTDQARVQVSSSLMQASPFDEELESVPHSDRRRFFQRVVAATTAASTAITTPDALAATEPTTVVPTPVTTSALSWPLGKVAFSLLPLAGTSSRRATVQETVIPDKIWTFDQLQGVVNVNVPVRMTVIKLDSSSGGGLWVHNPIAPTPQLLTMIRDLTRQHGEIRHIVLGSVALEHKATFGSFAQNFPKATAWIQPGQWAFPVDLPIEFLGVTQRGNRLRELPDLSSETQTKASSSKSKRYSTEPPEWAEEIPYEILGPLKFQSVGGFSETAFFHKPTKTLLATDTVVSVTKTSPPIIQEDPRAMLFHARNKFDEIVQDTPETRQRGWRRMVQFGLVFFPSQIDVVPFTEALVEARNIDPSMRNLGEGAVPFSLYPWTWKGPDVDVRNFAAISKNGALFCPPILTKLILDREPDRTLEWVDRVCTRFDFDHVIPSHLNNYVKSKPRDFRKAFEVLESRPGNVKLQRALPEDLALLQKASDLLTRLGVVGESVVCDGEPARQLGRFASQ